jgi:hypothetical protein
MEPGRQLQHHGRTSIRKEMNREAVGGMLEQKMKADGVREKAMQCR